MQDIIITILTQGSIAFIGSRITKVLGQVEISELIGGSGWALVGVSLLKIIVPMIQGSQAFFDRIDTIAEKLSCL